MLAFTLRMIITDIQRSFSGFWIIVYFSLLGIITVGPFFEDNFYVLYYVVIILFSVLIPRITKVFYVLPLGSKLLRRYLHLRSIVLSSLFIVAGTIMVLISLKWPVPSLEKGCLMIMSYVIICILMSFATIGETTKKNSKQNHKKYNIVFAVIIIILSGSVISALFLINFKIQLLISILFAIISEALLIIGLRMINLINYVEPVYYGILTKGWREQQRVRQIKQFTDAKRGKI